jgi:hypothetical protein
VRVRHPYLLLHHFDDLLVRPLLLVLLVPDKPITLTLECVWDPAELVGNAPSRDANTALDIHTRLSNECPVLGVLCLSLFRGGHVRLHDQIQPERQVRARDTMV